MTDPARAYVHTRPPPPGEPPRYRIKTSDVARDFTIHVDVKNDFPGVLGWRVRMAKWLFSLGAKVLRLGFDFRIA